jgi:hypothetical protein
VVDAAFEKAGVPRNCYPELGRTRCPQRHPRGLRRRCPRLCGAVSATRCVTIPWTARGERHQRVLRSARLRRAEGDADRPLQTAAPQPGPSGSRPAHLESGHVRSSGYRCSS